MVLAEGATRDQAAAIAEVAEAERRRCAALVAGDHAGLARLIARELVHVHGHGGVDDRAGYLAGVERKYVFHSVERGALNIRCHGDVAIVNGTLRQAFTDRLSGIRYGVEGVSTQTWIREDGRWRQNTCHNNFLTMEPLDATG